MQAGWLVKLQVCKLGEGGGSGVGFALGAATQDLVEDEFRADDGDEDRSEGECESDLCDVVGDAVSALWRGEEEVLV